MHGGEGACIVRGMCGRGHAWQGVCVVGGGMHGRGAMHGRVLPSRYYDIRVNERAVRILLECILVGYIKVPGEL